MVLKTKRTDIGNGSTINFGATVMSGAVLEPNTTVLPLAMVLKEMHLPTGLYQGSPTELARDITSMKAADGDDQSE
jgi:carbonic anhydrase/acetyltransferase-like protein (isoleucine patch superfamily)